MTRYYDPEYDRIVDESEIKRQYEWFAKQTWFNKTYEQFRADNFQTLRKYLEFSEMGHFVRDTDNLKMLKDDIQEFGGRIEDVYGNIIASVGV